MTRQGTLDGTQLAAHDETTTSASQRPIRLPLWLFVALAVFLLLVGVAREVRFDVAEYQCYALAFWGGTSAATAPSASICATYLGTAHVAAFHTLPHEYGPLALAVLSLPLLGPAALYPWLFAVEMLAFVVGVALLLQRVGRAGASHAWLLYVMLGSAATAATRFDVIPAACTLLALVALRRGGVPHWGLRQGWAYTALAAGALLKLYPALLLPLFLIESWRQRRTSPFWRGPAVFAGIVALVEGAAWLLNPSSVLAPLGFLQGRCVQVESLPATLSALGVLLRGQQLAFSFSYNSICQISPGLEPLSIACTALALAGVLFVVALFWRGRLSLGLAAILVLALAMLGSKVFSPQYILWLSPLVAWEYGVEQMRAFLGWSLVCLATTLCYPLAYTSLLLVAFHTTSDTAVPLAAGLRNGLLLGLVGLALITATRHARRTQDYTARTSRESLSGG